MIRRIVLAAVTASLVATVVVAQTDPIKEREALMKEFGRATRPIGGMLKGSVPFDLATVQASIDVYIKNSKLLPSLFPSGSDAGDTKALPAIWQHKEEFGALFAKLNADATKARAEITDLASLKAVIPGVLETCDNCHDSYRKR